MRCFPVPSYGGYRRGTGLLTSDVNLDPVGTVVPATSLHCKLSTFPFHMRFCRSDCPGSQQSRREQLISTLRNVYVYTVILPQKIPVPSPRCICLLNCISMGSYIYFALWVTIQRYIISSVATSSSFPLALVSF